MINNIKYIIIAFDLVELPNGQYKDIIRYHGLYDTTETAKLRKRYLDKYGSETLNRHLVRPIIAKAYYREFVNDKYDLIGSIAVLNGTVRVTTENMFNDDGEFKPEFMGGIHNEFMNYLPKQLEVDMLPDLHILDF